MKEYSMRQVSKHADDESCWIVVNGKVTPELLTCTPDPYPNITARSTPPPRKAAGGRCVECPTRCFDMPV
jgi:hypothetical protein